MQTSWLKGASARVSASSVSRILTVSLGLLLSLAPSLSPANDFCPDVYRGGVLPLNFNPTFIHVDKFNHANGNSYDGLVVSSFYNVVKNAEGTSSVGYFERDLVARIEGIGYRWPVWWDKDRDVEVISDLDLAEPVLPRADGQQIWPNEAQRVPDGILPFEAVVVPEGFHTAAEPGGITIINLDDPARTTYEVTRSVQDGWQCKPESDPAHDPTVKPRFYHLVKWFDMDGDGLKDAVSSASGFKVAGAFCFPPVGEIVWFKNPGAALDPNTHWQKFIISGFPVNENSADISLDMYDFEGDGVPEIVGNHFFTGKLISIIGAPVGQTWDQVDPATNPPRMAQISSGMGAPFGVRIADLNGDGKVDVLATNHQGDNCTTATAQPISGKVYAVEQPASGDIFNDPWVTHILKDDIRPNPSYPLPASSPGRLAPGLAQEFWRAPFYEATERPWILVGGDEASKVWLLKPNSQNPNDWTYSSAVIFDINDTYGPNTSQSFTAPAPATGVSISTIGGVTWRYDRDWGWDSWAEIYIPVFEGRDIHRISFRPRGAENKIACPADGALACAAP